MLLGRWRLTLDLFGRVFCDDVGAEPGSVISELGGFPVKESKFRREMERLRNSQQRDLTLEVRKRTDESHFGLHTKGKNKVVGLQQSVSRNSQCRRESKGIQFSVPSKFKVDQIIVNSM